MPIDSGRLDTTIQLVGFFFVADSGRRATGKSDRHKNLFENKQGG
jgi:hypothetical protein